MRTHNKEKIDKAGLLFSLIQMRLKLEKEEQELKEYFKAEIKDGFLECGEYLIVVEKKSRINLDRSALAAVLGPDISDYERIKEFYQVTVKKY